MYRYQILLDHMQKNAREFGWTLEEAVEKVNEKSQRKELFDAENALETAHGSLTSTKSNMQNIATNSIDEMLKGSFSLLR